jgi:hypothetical protein
MMDEPLHPSGGLTPMRPPMLSQTTGQQPVGEQPPSSTGMQLSERGVEGTRLGRWFKQQIGPFNLPVAAERILSNSLPSHLVMMPTSSIAADGQFDGAKVRFQMKPGMDRGAAKRDLGIIEQACRPSSKADAAKHVAVLKARTKSANQDRGEAQFGAEVMVGDLSAYPLDVIEYACNYWVAGGGSSKWFPSWPELREICERRVQPRRALLKALQWVAAGEPENAL